MFKSYRVISYHSGEPLNNKIIIHIIVSNLDVLTLLSFARNSISNRKNSDVKFEIVFLPFECFNDKSLKF